MLNRVTITGFRSCEQVVLDDLGMVTALIGRNSAGKSNVLKSIAALARLACSTGPAAGVWGLVPFYPPSPSDPFAGHSLSFEADVTIGERAYRYTASACRTISNGQTPQATFNLQESLGCGTTGQATAQVFKRSGEQIILSPTGPLVGIGAATAAMPALASLLPADHPSLAITEPLRRFFAQVRYYPLDEPAESQDEFFIQEDAYRKWLSEYDANGRLGDNVPMQVLHLRLARDDAFAELKNRLGKNGLRLVDDILIQPLPAPGDERALWGYAIGFRISRDAARHDIMLGFGALSQGTRRLVRLLTAMTYADCSVMLIEHPEDSIHKGLVRKIAGLFTTGSSKSQVILSTHSDTLMNALEPQSIRFVSLENGTTSVRKLAPEELEAAAEYLKSDVDGTLSEFLHSVED